MTFLQIIHVHSVFSALVCRHQHKTYDTLAYVYMRVYATQSNKTTVDIYNHTYIYIYVLYTHKHKKY